MKKIHYIRILFFVILIILFIFLANKPKNNNEENDIKLDTNTVNIKEDNYEKSENENSINDVQTNEVIEDDISKIEEIKKAISSNANTQIYQIDEEPGGREILQIKPSVQFEVDLAGIIKNAKPEEKEIQELIKNSPNKSGIWISENSRKKFTELLNKNEIFNFEIKEDGYLISNENSKNNIAKELEYMIKSNKLYIVNIKGISYERDYISGEIVEYPFEDMDPIQIIEPYIEKNITILEVTSNKKQKLTDKEILEAITKFK